jgi:hypothetical protein
MHKTLMTASKAIKFFLLKILFPENRVLSLRKLRSDEPHKLHSTPNNVQSDQIKESEIGGRCSMHGENGKYVKDFSRNS